MAFDIEQMKADGVSAHLIELASMNQETFLLLIARRLEHDKLFQQFMGENAGSIEAMYPYAVAAGLMSESDREWLIDEENPYKPQSGEVWYTGEIFEDHKLKIAVLTETDKANTADLIANYTNYNVAVNGHEMVITEAKESTLEFENSDESAAMIISYENNTFSGSISFTRTDAETAEVTIAHK